MKMKFDLSKYSTVAERLAKFHADHEDGRIVTEWVNANEYDSWDAKDPNVKRIWVIKTSLYLTAGDQANNLPKATGHAFEIDGGPGANQTSAMENSESSSLGRALMVMGYSMNKDSNTLASREEMEKVQRGVTAKPSLRDYEAEASKLTDVDGLRWLYAQAKGEGASTDVLERLAERAKSFSAEGEDSGNRGSVSPSKKAGAA
jgi:hypothetical protein